MPLAPFGKRNVASTESKHPSQHHAFAEATKKRIEFSQHPQNANAICHIDSPRAERCRPAPDGSEGWAIAATNCACCPISNGLVSRVYLSKVATIAGLGAGKPYLVIAERSWCAETSTACGSFTETIGTAETSSYTRCRWKTSTCLDVNPNIVLKSCLTFIQKAPNNLWEQ